MHIVEGRDALKTKSSRRKFFDLHSWVGFHLAFIMSVILMTGTIATVSNEIDWLVHPELRATTGESHVPWQTMTNAIQEYSPNSTIVAISALEGDYLTHRARVIDRQGNQEYIYVDQWSGRVTGSTGLFTVQRFFRDLHRYLFMPAVLGLPIVTSMAFILAISLYTGIKTSRNWTTLMIRIRINKGMRVFIGDAHKTFGLWAVWFLMLIIVTSLWYLFEFGAVVAGTRLEPNRPILSSQELETFGDEIKIPIISDVVIAAKSAYPELTITEIQFPSRVNQAITVLGVIGNPILRSRANRVFLNPHSLEAIKVQRSKDIGWIAWINEIADPLHFGFFGGLYTKLIWFVFGLALTALSLTGVWLTWKRTKKKNVSKVQYATMPILIIVMFLGSYRWYLYQQYGPPSEVSLTKFTEGTISVKPIFGISKEGDIQGQIRFLISGTGGRINLKTISVNLDGNKKKSFSKTLKLQRSSEVSVSKVNFNQEHISKAEVLNLSLELNSGRHIVMTWSLEKIDTDNQNDK